MSSSFPPNPIPSFPHGSPGETILMTPPPAPAQPLRAAAATVAPGSYGGWTQHSNTPAARALQKAFESDFGQEEEVPSSSVQQSPGIFGNTAV
jgi:hypothetical protein